MLSLVPPYFNFIATSITLSNSVNGAIGVNWIFTIPIQNDFLQNGKVYIEIPKAE